MMELLMEVTFFMLVNIYDLLWSWVQGTVSVLVSTVVELNDEACMISCYSNDNSKQTKPIKVFWIHVHLFTLVCRLVVFLVQTKGLSFLETSWNVVH